MDVHLHGAYAQKGPALASMPSCHPHEIVNNFICELVFFLEIMSDGTMKHVSEQRYA